jgi:hypothetical protein
LWAIGHIGSSSFGFKIIKEAKIMKDIVKMAESSEILSIRGYNNHYQLHLNSTCIYILGLVSKTHEGRKEIQKLNWRSA